jgi:hypothetical protein
MGDAQQQPPQQKQGNERQPDEKRMVPKSTKIETSFKEEMMKSNANQDGTEPMDIDDTTPSAPPPPPTTTTTTSTTTTKLTSPKQAIQLILQSNFDSTSKTYFITILKIIDNLLCTTQSSLEKQKKVRSLRLSNPTIQKKNCGNQLWIGICLADSWISISSTIIVLWK